jgi:hypothetical protein
MAEIDPLSRSGGRLTRFLTLAWSNLQIPPAPDQVVDAPVTDHEAWLRQLARERYALEQARVVLLQDGWTSGGWFTIRRPSGEVRIAGGYEGFGLLGPQASVVNACLVGTLLRMAEDPDQVPTVSDVWGCVDELYEAMHEHIGHVSFPPGRAYPMSERRVRLRALTTWNDECGRTRDDVVDVVDRAISRTIVAACH